MKKYAIGIDLGGTKILTALVDRQTGEVIEHVKKKTKKEKGAQNIIRKIIESINELLETCNLKQEDISSIGIGAAGQTDRENCTLIAAPNLDCYNLNFKKELCPHFNIPVFLGNDVEIAAIGEMKFGAAKGCDDFVNVREKAVNWKLSGDKPQR